jgi:hypothetical protein
MPSPGQKKQQRGAGIEERHFVCGIPGSPGGLGWSMAQKSTLGIGEKVSALQDPDKMMVHHVLHCLTQATSKADLSVTRCQRAVSIRFWNNDYSSFSPSI